MEDMMNKRGPNKLPYGIVEKVAKEMKINKQNAWRKIHIVKDPDAIELVNKEIRSINKKRQEGLAKYKELQLLIS